jgi:DDE superfamily endonuclease
VRFRDPKDHVGRLLQAWRGTPQVPMTRALPRDEEAIARGRAESWPALREQARRARRTLVFVDEAGSSLRPGVVKTNAPAGRTPVLRAKRTRDHLSVLGGMTPLGTISTLTRPESLNGWPSVEFLIPLRRVAGRRLWVLWDGSPIHRRAEVKGFVSDPHGEVWLEALPGDAPDWNPCDEGGWQPLKHGERRNLMCRDLEELHREFPWAVGRLRQKRHLIPSFFEAVGLTL